ncbi:hypothetical protein GLV98_12290 [Halobacillus litoralis]|uniref:Uncharacterized protein n=1 Tax=Halobacillus litoralis TaxID=45668 RepID=A0A845EGD7_9BACI|nr:hypothetical protein [Halobacillus litoralis]MYL50268.1 hypothetical protein [Halobacillus litoralis]
MNASANGYNAEVMHTQKDSHVLRFKKKKMHTLIESFIVQAYFEKDKSKDVIRDLDDITQYIDEIVYSDDDQSFQNHEKYSNFGLEDSFFGDDYTKKLRKITKSVNKTAMEEKKMGSVQSKEAALLRLSKSKGDVKKRFSQNMGSDKRSKVLESHELRDILNEKLNGYSLSKNIVEERDEERI